MNRKDTKDTKRTGRGGILDSVQQNAAAVFRCARLEKIEAIQRILGASSYAKYCEHLKKKGGEEKPLTREEFYLESLKRRYAGVSRCC